MMNELTSSRAQGQRLLQGEVGGVVLLWLELRHPRGASASTTTAGGLLPLSLSLSLIFDSVLQNPTKTTTPATTVTTAAATTTTNATPSAHDFVLPTVHVGQKLVLHVLAPAVLEL